MPRSARASGRSSGPCPAAGAERAGPPALAGALLVLWGALAGCRGGGGQAGTGAFRDAGPIPDGAVIVDAAEPEADPTIFALCAPNPPAGPATLYTGDGGCTATIAHHPVEGCAHVACPQAVSYATVPPSSGDHYPYWPDFRTYTGPVPWGNLVHALEHGAVVISYNCPEGCPDEVAAAQAFIDALPADPLCSGADPRRVILVPDPTLPAPDVRFAASAWTWTLRASCFLEDAFAAFVRDHYGQGREALCGELHLEGAALCGP